MPVYVWGKAIEVGANDAMDKPIYCDELSSMIDRLLINTR
jgi:DNA-binding response OmpR family regulator